MRYEQFTSHPSQKREGWGTRAFWGLVERGKGGTRLFELVGSARVGHPAFDVLGNATTPEPGSVLLLEPIGVLVAWRRKLV
jgi:hypothetical protein